VAQRTNSEHGTNGPVHIAPHEIPPISKLILESMQSKGLPLIDDLFTTQDIYGEQDYLTASRA
jgi:hypothetical protein